VPKTRALSLLATLVHRRSPNETNVIFFSKRSYQPFPENGYAGVLRMTTLLGETLYDDINSVTLTADVQ